MTALTAGLVRIHRTELLRLAAWRASRSGLDGALLARGNGASFQREEYRRSGRLSDVVSRAADVTAS